MANGQFTYKFELANIADYKLVLSAKIGTNKVMVKIFEQAKKNYKNKTDVSIEGRLENLSEFEVEEHFNKLFPTILKSQLKQIEKEIEQDKIKIMSFICVKAFFKRIGEDWFIFIRFGGQYADYR